jgi:dTDP-glucose 4,6-dehydratase
VSKRRLKFLITGGSGFIGSAVIRFLIKETNHEVCNIDKLTYAANRHSLQAVENSDRYTFSKLDICDRDQVSSILRGYQPDVVMHLAAETHVDKSITGSSEFVKTNLLGTFELLEACRSYWESYTKTRSPNSFRFHHVSTDEVFGDLDGSDGLFTESSNYRPSSPYSATKAGADHLVHAWTRTYGLPAVISNCSNNYGPFQCQEKLIPRIILNALKGEPLPVFGDGQQIRDWLFVEDHARALVKIATEAHNGDRFNVGGRSERTNLQVVQAICGILDEVAPRVVKGLNRYQDLVSFVVDRPGHDRRYAIDTKKIEEKLLWKASETFDSGLRKTVLWYVENAEFYEN